MFKYHVTFGIEKSVISVRTRSLEAIRYAVTTEFGSLNEFSLQLWDGEFDDWARITTSDNIPDKVKIKVIIAGVTFIDHRNFEYVFDFR